MHPGHSEAAQRTHKAIGEFVTAFASLVFAMETAIPRLVFPRELTRDSHHTNLLQAAMGERTAEPITKSFFAAFSVYWQGVISREDEQITKRIRAEVISLIESRNRIMHDAYLWSGENNDSYKYRHRVSVTEVSVIMQPISAVEIQSFTSDAIRLSSIISGMVWYARPEQVGPELTTRPSGAYYIQNLKVFRKED